MCWPFPLKLNCVRLKLVPCFSTARSSARSWQMNEEDMDAGDEDTAGAPAAAGGGAGKARASPQNFRLVSVSLLLFLL